MSLNLTPLSQLTEDLENLVAIDDNPTVDPHLGQHPALKTVCVIDCDKHERIIPNSHVAVLSNDCFEGRVMLLMRTPDVDDELDTTHLGSTPRRISKFFKGKKRRFEFQFQIRLKRVPTGPLFLGCELEHSIKVGAITKGVCNILLAMVRRINPGFHYSWGPDRKMDPKAMNKGDYEKTHLSFPVEASMDRIVITKPGQTPPELGHELYESDESVKRRRKQGAGSVDWNLDDTYTMCLWSAYCDWIQWKAINLPGMSPFSLCRVTSQQPIYLSVYEIDGCTPAEYRKKKGSIPHNRNKLRIYTRLEFTNDEKTVGGYAERLVGRSKAAISMSGDSSLPDTESVDSDFETASRVSHITMS